MKKILRYFLILLVNLVFIIYIAELFLFFFLPDTQKTLIKINETRLKIANEKGLKYDTRNRAQVFYDMAQSNPNLVPAFNFNKRFAEYETFKKAIKSNKPIPFRGPINKQTLSCAEDLNYRLINNDYIGYKNPDSIYESNIEIILLGDSYAEGLCYDENNDIAANLRKENYNSANFGVTGTGPLVSLGVFREYVEHFKPKYVIYFYYEGNDIPDLLWEKNNILLKKYIKESFSQNLMSKEKEISKFLYDISKDSYSYIKSQVNNKISNDVEKENFFREYLKDFLELNSLRNYVKNNFYLIHDKSFDEDLFFSIINRMNNETNLWGGKFIFVYTPSWSRYFTKFTKLQRYTSKKDLILKQLKKNNIHKVDLTAFFDHEEDLKQYFPLGYIGHYNEKGYKKISEIVIDKINEIK